MIHEIVIPANTKKELVFIHDSPETSERVIRLSGSNAEVYVDEIFLSGSVKSNLVIIHDSPNTRSRIKTRGVVGKAQTVSANAKIVIPKHGQLSDSFVSQNFLLLDETSRADAVPSLEIEADEVKASHSATISPISSESIFYLTSRGVSEAVAKKLLIEGFLKIPKGYEHLLARFI